MNRDTLVLLGLVACLIGLLALIRYATAVDTRRQAALDCMDSSSTFEQVIACRAIERSPFFK